MRRKAPGAPHSYRLFYDGLKEQAAIAGQQHRCVFSPPIRFRRINEKYLAYQALNERRGDDVNAAVGGAGAGRTFALGALAALALIAGAFGVSRWVIVPQAIAHLNVLAPATRGRCRLGRVQPRDASAADQHWPWAGGLQRLVSEVRDAAGGT
ncbi:hypothetical protein M8494_11450 [Serratia ureilytica]